MFRAEALEVSSVADPALGRVPLSASMTTSLVAAVIWAGVDVVRLGGAVAPVAAFVALLGAASLTLGVVVALVGSPGRTGDGMRAVLLGAAASAAPLAAAGAVLQRSTHHRALGGMTFAVFAFLVTVFACGVAFRVVAVARAGQGSRARVARIVTFAVPVASAACVLLALAPSLFGSGALHPLLVDGATGAVVLAVAIPCAGTKRFDLGRASTALWCVAVVAGATVAVRGTPLGAVLAQRAPVAFASFSAFSR